MFMSGKARELPEEAQELLTSAYQGNERLIRTINNVLDMIDLESSEIVIKKKKNVDVDNLIKNAISDFDEQASAKGINLTYKKSQKLPLLNINPFEIAKVIKHLLDNALKFTKKGSIIIFTKIKKNEVIVSVRDTGMGISKEDQKFLFQKFLRLSKPQKNQSANDELGLGLYICHTIVEKHGGKIWVESQKDRGSTFSFSLPLK
jgi:signal transduction histidine kinase